MRNPLTRLSLLEASVHLAQVDPNNPLQRASDAGAAIQDAFWSHGLAAVPVTLTAVGWGMALRYRHRRRIERRITGRDASLKHLPELKLKKGQKASEVNPAMPAVPVKKLPAERLVTSLESTAGTWTFPGTTVDEPHVAILGRSGAGKNETLLDPALYNAIFHRPEPVVVNDVKGAMSRKFGPRIAHTQYRYTFDRTHRSSARINLVETPEMAQYTAAAVWPIAGQKVQIYNRLARALFLALVEHLGYGRASLVEVYRLASNRDRMKELAENDAEIGGIIGGENKTLAGDVLSSLTAPLEPLKDEWISRVFAPSGEQPTLDEKMVVWIVIPEGMEGVLGPLAGAIMRNLYERAKAVPEVVRFFVDEAGSCLAFDDLAQYLLVGRGRGVYFTLVLQDISQLAAKIGLDNTRSALGSVGVHFWGPSNDPATTHYVSDLSGTVQVARPKYEKSGSERALQQFWSSIGAKYEWEYFDRAVIQPHHVNGLPRGYWYRYAGDPMAIKLIIPEPMYCWIEDVLPSKTKPRYRGVQQSVPREPSEATLPAGTGQQPPDPLRTPPEQGEGYAVPNFQPPTAHVPNFRPKDYENGRQNGDGRRHPDGTSARACEGCPAVVEDREAVFCSRCGSRLPS